MNKSKLFAVLAVVLVAGVAVAQEVVKMATPETPVAELIEITQAAIAQDKIDTEAYDKRRAEEFQMIGEMIEAEIRNSDDVKDLRRIYPETNGHQTGIAYRFKYLDRPIWVMFVEKDEFRGLDGERNLMVVASGRAGKTIAEQFLLGMAPEIYHVECNRDVRRELEARFGVQWEYVRLTDSFSGHVDAPIREVAPGKAERSVKPEVDKMFEICRKIGDDYRTAQQPQPKK